MLGVSIFYPFELFSRWLTYDVFQLKKDSVPGDALEFFIFDTLKIFFLLCALIFLVSFIRSYFPLDKVRKVLSHKKIFMGHLFASLLGIITPFCSCSAIPLFLAFIEAKIPVGVTFSFLVAAPMINEVALILLLGLFGWKVALLYIASGLVIAMVSGFVIGKVGAEKWIKDLFLARDEIIAKKLSFTGWKQRVSFSAGYTYRVLKGIWFYVFIGIGLGAWIHGYVPSDFLTKYAGGDSWYGPLVATLVGVPLYSNAAGVIPLVGSLMEKGMSLGTTLAFMMAVTGLSLPEFLILKRVMNIRLILLFAFVVWGGILMIGYLFNFIL